MSRCSSTISASDNATSGGEGDVGGITVMGIDLGTTNCCVGVLRKSGVEILSNAEGEILKIISQ